MTEIFFRITSSEVLAILVSRFLGFLRQLHKKQNGRRYSIGSKEQYFMNTGWHTEPRVFFNK